ncbi:hypothetical protein ACS0TY_023957 [Phlomoides rotata]
MVKSPDRKKQSPSSSFSAERLIAAADSSSCKYKGVRKRKWGKFVSEIRLPNCRERIWLGSYDTAEKAARAFDAALFCLRGRNAKFNFPDAPPDIANAPSMTPAQIQAAASRFAHSAGASGRVEDLDSQSDSVSVESPCPSVSECGVTEMPLDTAFLDQFFNMGTENDIPDFGLFPGFDDFMANPFPSADYYWPDNNNDEFTSQGSFLWNF